MYFVQNPMHPIFLGAFLIDDAACIVRWTLTLLIIIYLYRGSFSLFFVSLPPCSLPRISMLR